MVYTCEADTLGFKFLYLSVVSLRLLDPHHKLVSVLVVQGIQETNKQTNKQTKEHKRTQVVDVHPQVGAN